MFNKSLVSVLIPAYDHEKYVQETIKSIINQTYQNIELIIVDDGSKDSTWQKIQEMREECEKRFVRIHFETKGNEGTCKTFNRLLDLSKGEFVYFIASDDVAKPEAIKTEVKFLSKHKDYALVVGNNEIIDGDSKRAYWDKDKNLVYDKKQADFLTLANFLQKERKINFNSSEFGRYELLLLKANFIPNGYLIKKSIFKKIGYFTLEAPLEDHWLMLQISKYAKLKFINKILFSYRWHCCNTIKNIDRMIQYDNITLDYEKRLVKILDPIDFNEDTKMYFMYGERYSQINIPYILKIDKYRKNGKKTRIIKIFNLIRFFF